MSPASVLMCHQRNIMQRFVVFQVKSIWSNKLAFCISRSELALQTFMLHWFGFIGIAPVIHPAVIHMRMIHLEGGVRCIFRHLLFFGRFDWESVVSNFLVAVTSAFGIDNRNGQIFAQGLRALYLWFRFSLFQVSQNDVTNVLKHAHQTRPG